MNATKTLIATYPRRRPALSAAHQAIYEAEYKLNRNGDRFVEDLRILRDPYSAKPYVLFYTTKRVGGGVQNFDAIKVMKFAAS